jgi:PEP-CTERM motif
VNVVAAKFISWMCAALLLSTGVSEAASLVANGDFETGTLSGWTVNTGADPSHAPIVIGYNNNNGFPNGAYGESVPTPINGLTSGAYFSADIAAQSISQHLALVADTAYTLSFDLYAPQNGRNNPFDASLLAILNGSPISKVFSADSLTNGWLYYSTSFTSTAAAIYDFALNFQGGGSTAADFVVDNVSVASIPLVAAAVPEPATWAMLLIGFVGIGFLGYRRRRNQYTFTPNAVMKAFMRLLIAAA